MKKNYLLLPVMLGCIFVGLNNFSFKNNEVPKGWVLRGNDTTGYIAETDNTVKYGGKASGCLRCINEESTGFGTLMQMFQAKDYKGKMVMMSVYLRAEDVAWGGMFFRVDGYDNMLSFANMQDNPIEGTIDWKKYSITLPVPDDAVNIAFGSMLRGKGKIWADNYQFEIVANDAPNDDIATDVGRNQKWPPSTRTFPEKPANLDFEEK